MSAMASVNRSSNVAICLLALLLAALLKYKEQRSEEEVEVRQSQSHRLDHSALQCVPGTRGPACSSDDDCTAIAGCVRCARSRNCTDVSLGPRPSPPRERKGGPAPAPRPESEPAICQNMLPPIYRASSIKPAVPLASSWRYLQAPFDESFTEELGKPRPQGSSKLLEVAWSPELEDLCLDLFPHRKPPVSPAIAQSQSVCVLSHDGRGGNLHAVYYSEYNTLKHRPNFVAYLIPGTPTKRRVKVKRDWGSAQQGLDAAYGTGDVNACCWCEQHKNDSRVCGPRVSTRGHLATMSAFQSLERDMKTTNVFLNTVPTRQPFDGRQWNVFENANIDMAKALGRQGRKGLYVIAGPSIQSVGSIPVRYSTSDRMNVPVWLWSAYADLDTNLTVGHMCRNGGPDDKCACANNLHSKALEERIGFTAFPGLISSASPPSIMTDESPRDDRHMFWHLTLVSALLGACTFCASCMDGVRGKAGQ